MNRLALSFFLALFLYLLLFSIIKYDFAKNRRIITPPERHRISISALRILKAQKPTPKKSTPQTRTAISPLQHPHTQLTKPTKARPIIKKNRKKMIKLLPKKHKRQSTSSRKKKIRQIPRKRNLAKSVPSLEQLFAKKSNPVPKSTMRLPANIRKLYKDEYESFTKNQKRFIRDNLEKIAAITQKYLYLRGYPYIAAKMKEEGVNVVEFFFFLNGEITQLRIIKSSGYEALDKNSIETIKTAYKDYPWPKETTKIRILVRYSIIY